MINAMRKVLFITTKPITGDPITGGEQVSRRNYDSLCAIVGKGCVDTIVFPFCVDNDTFQGKAIKWFHLLLFGYNRGLTRKAMSGIKKRADGADTVFFDTSLYGAIAKALKRKKTNARLITFFHNVERSFRKPDLLRRPWLYFDYRSQVHNERYSCSYSDVTIALNERDSRELEQFYFRPANIIIPVSIKDQYKEHPARDPLDDPLNALFIGSDFQPNITGIIWFVKEVMPSVNMKLKIIGKGFGKIRSHVENAQVEVTDYLPDLTRAMEESDLVVLPIFEGSGMKLKTCEALMFGKNILGTSEAFCGYQIDYQKAGALCNTKEEFIAAINKLQASRKPRFNAYSRQIFLDRYSFDKTLALFKGLLN